MLPALERWRLRARVCACQIVDSVGASFVVISAYGIPPGHVERRANEDFVRDLLVALLSLKCPASLCGDLNDTIKESPSLSLATALGVFHLNPCGASTKKKRSTSMKEAIDHVFANKPALDMGPKVVFEPGIDLFDHIPLRLSVRLMQPDFEVVKWPSVPRNLPKQVCTKVPWSAEPQTFQEWQVATTQWLRESTEDNIPDKSHWSVTKFRCPSPQPDRLFCRLMRISRAVVEITRFGSNQKKVDSLRRKVMAIKRKSWISLTDHPAVLATEVSEAIRTYLNRHYSKALRVWKEMASQWGTSDASLYRYLRNPDPGKVLAVQSDDGVLTHPQAIQSELFRYWGAIESWQGEDLDAVLNVFDDKYSFLLPHSPFDLVDAAQRAKKSAAGLDAWSQPELALLPKECWSSFMKVCSSNPESLFSSVSGVFRRVPIPKVRGGGGNIC